MGTTLMKSQPWQLLRRVLQTLSLLPTLALVVIVSHLAHGAEHVIHISVDGLNSSLLKQLMDAGETPNFQRLRHEGASTLNARTDYTHTNTLPNHTCMLTGRPVLQPSDRPDMPYHGFTENSTPKVDAALHNKNNPHIGYVASVFDIVHDAGLSTSLYTSKDKFAIFDQSYDENHGATHEHGRDKIDVYFYASDLPPKFSSTMHARFLADMAKHRFHYAFVHYRDPDTAGHALGWGSSAWRYALRTIDGYVGDVLKLVENDPLLAGRTAILITADHGGKGYDHNDPSEAENYTIPIFIWGAGVARGDLYAMNPDSRTDPGDSRPDYTQAEQPIRNGDTGNLALALLGLGPIPNSVINARQDLRVALVGDFNLDGTVDSADYLLWRKTEGSTSDLRADANDDGRVDEKDHELWKAHLGQSAAGGR